MSDETRLVSDVEVGNDNAEDAYKYDRFSLLCRKEAVKGMRPSVVWGAISISSLILDRMVPTGDGIVGTGASAIRRAEAAGRRTGKKIGRGTGKGTDAEQGENGEAAFGTIQSSGAAPSKPARGAAAGGKGSHASFESAFAGATTTTDFFFEDEGEVAADFGGDGPHVSPLLSKLFKSPPSAPPPGAPPLTSLTSPSSQPGLRQHLQPQLPQHLQQPLRQRLLSPPGRDAGHGFSQPTLQTDPLVAAMAMQSSMSPSRTSLNLANALPASAGSPTGDRSLGPGGVSAMRQHALPGSPLTPSSVPDLAVKAQLYSQTQTQALARAPCVQGPMEETPPNLRAKCWWYRDPQGVIQGSFSTQEMRHWSSCGYFSPDLPIRYTENSGFYPLQQMFPPPVVAFQSSPNIPNVSDVASAPATASASWPQHSPASSHQLGASAYPGAQPIRGANPFAKLPVATMGMGAFGNAASLEQLQQEMLGAYAMTGPALEPPCAAISSSGFGHHPDLYGHQYLERGARADDAQAYWSASHAAAAAAKASMKHQSSAAAYANSAFDAATAQALGTAGNAVGWDIAAQAEQAVRIQREARREARRTREQQKGGGPDGACASTWEQHAVAAKASPQVDFSSASDFPTLGAKPGVEEKVVMVDADDGGGNGGGGGAFWERPQRAVRVVTDSAIASEGKSSPATASNSAPRQTASPASTDTRREHIEDLMRETGLALDEPMISFLLTLKSPADALDYLQAYSGDTQEVRRFAEAFGQRKLCATVASDEARVAKDADAASIKVKKSGRSKGKQVDPSLLGFTAASTTNGRLMHG